MSVAARSEQLVIQRAGPDDLDRVSGIEQVSFPTPWSRSLLAEELARPGALYLKASVGGELVGYVGLWHYAGEGHVCTLAVDPGWRGHGIGEALVICALEQAAGLGAEVVALEYRVSNHGAARLYEKLGFAVVGRRPRYYHDTGEDAVLAACDGLRSPHGARALVLARERWEQERDFELAIEL